MSISKKEDNMYSDADLLGYTLWDLNSAMEHVMDLQSEHRDTLFHMIHSIMFYVEEYLNKEGYLVKATSPKELIGDKGGY